MTLPGLTAKNQNDLVQQELNNNSNLITETIKPPGIDILHTKPIDEIAAVLANLLKSRGNLKAFKFVVGSHLELTFDQNPLNQIR
jgi:hypothetical protein